MTIILFIFMSDIFFLCMSDEGCFTFIIQHFVRFMVKLYEYLMRGCEKACKKAWPPVNIKTAIFNLQYLSHFCMTFNVRNMSRSAYNTTFLMIYK